MSSLPIAAMVCVASAPALSQVSAAPAPDAPAPNADIVVTGSRVAANGFASPTPVTIVGQADIQRDAPVNIADFVNKLPGFASSITSQNSGNADGNAGVNELDLHGLGANRTLVLLDGVRVAPGSVAGFYHDGGSVDINPFPDALVKQVDTATGGASAVYGSDAISGAVNFILDKDFTGLKGEASNSVTTYGDDNTYRLSLTGGVKFADGRGHLLVSVSDTHSDGVPAGARSWLNDNSYGQITNPAYSASNGQPQYLLVSQYGSSLYKRGGLVTGGGLQGTDFGQGGAQGIFDYGALDDGTGMSGGDWRETSATKFNSINPQVSLAPELSRVNVFSRVGFNILDDVEVYGQGMYSRTRSVTDCCAGIASFAVVSGNPFIPSNIQAEMNSLGLSALPMGEELGEGGLVQLFNKRRFTQFVAGSDGRFAALGSDWKFDVYATRSQTHQTTTSTNDLNYFNFFNAIDVVTNPANGQPICASTSASPGNGCVPFNPFGTGVNSKAAWDYIDGDAHMAQTITQTEESGTVKGHPVSTWAGPVEIAFGAEHRTEKVRGTSSALDQAFAFYDGNFQPTNGSLSSTEGFFEILAPLAKDYRFAKELNLNGAVRLTDYSTSGMVVTWKAGATYAPVSGLLFRVTRSRDIRAPNLGELYSSGQVATTLVHDDFRDNEPVLVSSISRGNPDLKPEKSDTTSAGVTFQPGWAPGLRASFDYYRTRIRGAINSAYSQDIVDACYAGQAAFCNAIIRDASGAITTIYGSFANTAFVKSSGFDLEVGYRRPLSDFFDGAQGSVSVRALASHLIHMEQQLPSGQILDGAGVNGELPELLAAPSWHYNITLAYDGEHISTSVSGHGFSAGVQDTAWVQCSSNCPASTAANPTYNDIRMPGAIYVDLNVTAHVHIGAGRMFDIFGIVENVANNNPKNVIFLNYGPTNYELEGRIFRTGIRFEI